MNLDPQKTSRDDRRRAWARPQEAENQAALRARQDELESFMVAADAMTWPEAAAKARYLIQLYAATPDAQDPRRQRLIAGVIADLVRLSE